MYMWFGLLMEELITYRERFVRVTILYVCRGSWAERDARFSLASQKTGHAPACSSAT